MGDSATAMRDPIFYRWHAYIDDLFQEYKATLPRYSEANVIRNYTNFITFLTLKILADLSRHYRYWCNY